MSVKKHYICLFIAGLCVFLYFCWGFGGSLVVPRSDLSSSVFLFHVLSLYVYVCLLLDFVYSRVFCWGFGCPDHRFVF